MNEAPPGSRWERRALRPLRVSTGAASRRTRVAVEAPNAVFIQGRAPRHGRFLFACKM